MLSDICKNGSRLEQLHELKQIIAEALDSCGSMRDIAQLSRQYRETLKEIEEIEGVTVDNDEIGNILADRQANGKPGAVR